MCSFELCFPPHYSTHVISRLQAGSESLGALEEKYEAMEQKINEVRWRMVLSVVRIEFT